MQENNKSLGVLNRTNLALKTAEDWPPPLFGKVETLPQKILFAIRRCLDLQTSSIWRDLAQLLPNVRGSVLDVGCGAQPYRSLLPKDTKYVGIDSKDAKAHFGYEFPDTLYFEGSTWPIDDASFHFVLCTETMEHVMKPAVLLREAFRCLSKDGTLLLTVPFAARWHFIPYDYWRFTPSGLERLLSAAGFENIRVYARGNTITVACYKVMALLLRLGMPQSQFWIVRMILRLLFLLVSPVFLILTLIANLSLAGKGGDDCLGYTALANKSAK